MRSLAEPQVLKFAAAASVGTALACFPRLAYWTTRTYPLWYLTTLLILGAFVLWAFVFAWYPRYVGRPVFTLQVDRRPFLLANTTGVGGAVLLYLFADPVFRSRAPADYPGTVLEWVHMTLFSLAFSQLFLVFAPLAWLMRLFKGKPIAAPLAVLFGVFVLVLRQTSDSVPPAEFWALVSMRILIGALAVHLFLRGGVALVWWWSLLIQGRHLLRIATSN